MQTPQTATDIAQLYELRGGLSYEGEGISQLQHAWQCGQLAASAGADAALQLAAWLHDLGHLMTGLAGSPTLDGVDDRHEVLAARALAPLFGPAVSQPVALHVQAKRYLVGSRPDYQRGLSPDSLRSLALQGGAMGAAECEHFLATAFSQAALRLRVWDDQGKRSDWQPASTGAALAQLKALMAFCSLGPPQNQHLLRPRAQ
ncbi:putative HD phosphohydrolase [Burkholderiales bacterium JOSHI_001]|nr:putative HD phosphohydrolase [Burkholderiales bacterium JOSHI_001]